MARQDAHAQTGGHHQAQRVVAGDLYAQLQRHFQQRCAAVEQAVDGTARMRAHKVIGQRLLHGDVRAVGQRVATGGNQDQLILAVGHVGQIAAVVARVQDAKVCGVLGHGQRNFTADFFQQVDLYFWVLGHKALQLRRQELGDGRDVGHHAHMPAHTAAVFAHVACDAIHLPQHVARQIQQGIGRRRGCNAAVAAFKQAHLQLGFQLCQTAAGRRGGNVLAHSGTGNGLLFHDSNKQAQGNGVESHACILLCLNSIALFFA